MSDRPETFGEHGVYRSLFTAYPDALLLVDAQGKIVLANPAAERLLGHAPGGLQGIAVDALVPDAIRPRHAAYRDAYATAPRARPMGKQTGLVARCADGSEVMVEIALSPLQEHGLPYVVAAVRDIGDYPRVRQALQRARYSECVAEMGRLAVDAREPRILLERIPPALRELLEVDSAAVFRLDADGRSFRLAGGCGAVIDALPALVVANAPHTGLGHLAAHREPLLMSDFERERRFEVLPAIAALGLRGALAVPLSDQGQVTGAIVVWTRAERKFGDEESRFLQALAGLLATTLQRADTEAALRHSQRLDSVGQLTGGIAHDFNNLLTVIQGNLQVLEDHAAVASDALASQFVAAAMRASRRGAELTGKLLAFSRRQLLQPQHVDIGLLLQSLADMLRRTLDQRIGIELDLPAEPAFGLVDPGQLESALLNIAINARDAMPAGGRLSFVLRAGVDRPAAGPGEHDEVAAPAVAYVSIAISDNGEGMSEDVRARAFEPFYTTKEAGRGTGLGLSTVYGFVRQSLGAITIDSRPGAGTTVTVYLPQGQGAPVAVVDDTAAADRGPRHALAVLLVEDEPEVLKVVATLLQGLGCTVEACDSAERALDHLAGGALPDLVLSDVVLGTGLRGTDLARLVALRWPALPVLLMTGYAASAADAAPTGPLLRKPFTRAELAQAIARLAP